MASPCRQLSGAKMTKDIHSNLGFGEGFTVFQGLKMDSFNVSGSQ